MHCEQFSRFMIQNIMNNSFRAAVCLSFTLACPAARANDSAFSAVGGSMQPMKGQHSTVRMERERIVIDAYADRYETTVDFVFHNTGHKNVATMGFPEDNYGDVPERSGNKSTFRYFRTSVDGKPFKAVRIPSKDNGEDVYDAYWVKTVPFARGQKRRVKVSYSSPYSGTAMLGFSRAISYAFTGQNWKGDVARSDVEIRVHTPGHWLMMSQWNESEKPSTTLSWQRRGSGGSPVFVRSWHNWQAQGSMLVGLVPARAGWLVSKRYATDASSSWSRAIIQSVDIEVPGKDSSGIEPFEGFPIPGIVHKGLAFVQLSHLETELRDSTEKLNVPGASERVKLLWEPAKRSATLVAHQKKYTWRVGGSTWVADGKPLYLPAVPFVFNGALYVPAAASVKELGGTVTANAAQHWIDIKVPAAR